MPEANSKETVFSNPSIKVYLESLVSLIYPRTCLVCSTRLNPERKKPLCEECLSKIALIQPPFCIKCGLSLPGPSSHKAGLCIDCQRSMRRYPFLRAWSACLYSETLRKCIHILKYNKRQGLAVFLSQFIIAFTRKNTIMDRFDLIVPVPLHSVKKRERGFNQAHLLTKPIAREFNLPLSSNLRRIGPNISQTTLSRQDRFNNIRGAFASSRSLEFQDRNILLIDDVFTTGATVSECARVLYSHGARSVCVLTLARGDRR